MFGGFGSHQNLHPGGVDYLTLSFIFSFAQVERLPLVDRAHHVSHSRIELNPLRRAFQKIFTQDNLLFFE